MPDTTSTSSHTNTERKVVALVNTTIRTAEAGRVIGFFFALQALSLAICVKILSWKRSGAAKV
jgi:hypothetical protein